MKFTNVKTGNTVETENAEAIRMMETSSRYVKAIPKKAVKKSVKAEETKE